MSSAFTWSLTVVFVNECQCCGLRPWSYDKTVSDQCRSWSWSWSQHFGLVSNSGICALLPDEYLNIGYVVNVTALNMAGIWLHCVFSLLILNLY